MSRRPTLHYSARAVLDPLDRCELDRELAERRAIQQAANREARAAWRRARTLNHGGHVCRICGTPISAAASVARGIGPVCNHRLEETP